MNYFLQSTTEENLYLCIQNHVWGSKTNKLGTWRVGDKMIAYVDRRLAALFTIRSETFTDSTPIWDADTYPYRVKIELEKIIAPPRRYSISNPDLRNILFQYHGSSYAVGLVLSARPMAEPAARILLDTISALPAWENFDLQAALVTEYDKRLSTQELATEDAVEARSEQSEAKETTSRHTEMQYYLARLGLSMKYKIWIPKADQSRRFNQIKLYDLSVQDLPPLPFTEEVVRIIKNIDVIWLQEGNPTHLFEVEHTTSIYSGLLRMSDLITVIPSLNIGMFICADPERKAKVHAEVNRPTFARRKVPLAKICRFISFEKLTEFMSDHQSILSHLNASILDEISESLVP